MSTLKGNQRNKPCTCGNGIKYKFCHYLIDQGEKALRIIKDGLQIANPNR